VERRPVERVRGTQDCWPHDARQLDAIRRRLEATFESFGYRRIEVPVLEPTELHLRKSGLEIISKLYAFEDQAGRHLCLRPELTASIVRAYVAQPAPRLPLKVFSSGPVFRYERPSKGRYRQFTHADAELIGAAGPLADAEIIVLATRALQAAGVSHYTVTIGHVGILADLLARLGLTGRLRSFLLESLEDVRRHGLASVRARLQELDPELFERADAAAALGSDATDEGQVRAAIAGFFSELGTEALGRRSEADVVERMLRKRFAAGANARAVERAFGFIERLGALHGGPEAVLQDGRALLAEYGLDDAPLQQLARTVELLVDLGVDPARVHLDLGLSRGLQYYTGMVFEIHHAGLGSESQLCGGGRYDDLVRALGGRQSVPALGFAFGVERVKLALEAEAKTLAVPPAPFVFVVAASPTQSAAAGRAALAFREAGVAADLEVSRRPLRASLAYADKEGFPYVAIVGELEARDGTVRLREMAGGEERVLPLADAAAWLMAQPILHPEAGRAAPAIQHQVPPAAARTPALRPAAGGTHGA
jgi:histidyl-tRNA synthetase